jgi:hypothetical protein
MNRFFMLFLNGWKAFWFKTSPNQTLCIFRIVIGLILLLKLTGLNGIHRWPTWKIQFPKHAFNQKKRFFMESFYNPHPLFEWLPSPSMEYFIIADYFLFVLTILFTIGLFTRIVGPLIALWFVYFTFSSQYHAYHHQVFFTFIFIVIGFSPCADYFSVDRFLAPSNHKPRNRMMMPLRLLQCYLAIVYAGSGLVKWSPEWFSGEIIEMLYNDKLIKGHFKDFIFKYTSYQMMGIYTVCTETFLIFALWSKKTRKIGILSGIFLHLGIDMMMEVTTFSYQMISMYVLFLEPNIRMTKVTYSSDNKLLWKTMRFAQLLDWLLRVEWNHNSKIKGIIVIEPDGKVRHGFDAVLEVLTRLPLTFIPATILQIVIHIASLKFVRPKNTTSPHQE